MTLLRTIQEAAIDADTSLPALLRKCKVLAARLNNDEFKNWVDNELNGYSNIDNLDIRYFKTLAQHPGTAEKVSKKLLEWAWAGVGESRAAV